MLFRSLANEMVNEFAEKMSAINNRPRQGKRPKVMLVAGHDLSSNPDNAPANICIAGKDDFYSTMTDIAGGLNAYTGAIPFPTVSYESIISMNPDIIIDIVSAQSGQVDRQVIKEQWKKLNLPSKEPGRNRFSPPRPSIRLPARKVSRHFS